MKYSIIIPVYNEEKRGTTFIENLIKFAKKELKDYEIIAVNDGSKDKTLELLSQLKKEIRIISYSPNHGKGFAVKTGMLAAKGDKIAFIDGDGAFPPEELLKIFSSLDSNDVVLGTKRSKETIRVTKEPLIRKITSFGFNSFVRMLFHEKIWDALCGLKGFRNSAAKYLASNLISERWIFDVELIIRAYRKKYSVKIVPVKLFSVEGSKFKITDPIKMIFQLIRLKYLMDFKK